MQDTECSRPGDPVNLEMERCLELPHRGFGPRSITSIDGTRRVAGSGQLPLQLAHLWGSRSYISIARAKHELCRGECLGGERAGNPIAPETVSGLEPDHGVLGQGSVLPVAWTRRVAQAGQPTLEHLYCDRAIRI